MPAVTCCIVAWNARERLPRLLRSLEAERAAGVDLEVIVVDNASQDGTAEMVVRDFPGVTVVASHRNRGYAEGQAIAATQAKGRALLFLNDDVEVPPGSLAALLAELNAHPECSAVGPALIGEAGEPQRSAGPLPTLGAALHRVRWLRWTGLFRRAHEAFRKAPLPPAGPVACLMGAAVLVRREAYAKAPWDTAFPFGLEDADLSARLGRVGQLRYAPQVTLRHVGGAASAKNPWRVVRGYELGWVRYMARHDPRAWAAPLLACATVVDLPLRAFLIALRALVFLVSGRASKAATSSGHAVATVWFLVTGIPALMEAARPTPTTVTRGLVHRAVPLWAPLAFALAALCYWPALRWVAPQAAVNASYQLTSSPGNLWGADPWDRSYYGTIWGVRSRGPDPISVQDDLFVTDAIDTPLVAALALAPWLFAAAGLLAIPTWRDPPAPLRVEILVLLWGWISMVTFVLPCAVHLYRHPKVLGLVRSDSLGGELRYFASIALAIAVFLVAFRLHFRNRAVSRST